MNIFISQGASSIHESLQFMNFQFTVYCRDLVVAANLAEARSQNMTYAQD